MGDNGRSEAARKGEGTGEDLWHHANRYYERDTRPRRLLFTFKLPALLAESPEGHHSNNTYTSQNIIQNTFSHEANEQSDMLAAERSQREHMSGKYTATNNTQ
jgi:hypothetical protein